MIILSGFLMGRTAGLRDGRENEYFSRLQRRRIPGIYPDRTAGGISLAWLNIEHSHRIKYGNKMLFSHPFLQSQRDLPYRYPRVLLSSTVYGTPIPAPALNHPRGASRTPRSSKTAESWCPPTVRYNPPTACNPACHPPTPMIPTSCPTL
jgi:hypothetical protein